MRRRTAVLGRWKVQITAAFLLGVVWLVGAAMLPPVHAQFLGADLPNMQGGDYGNGSASSGMVGSTFATRGAATSTPTIAYGIPVAYGADWRDVFGVVGYQRGLRGRRGINDGAVFGGFGLGDAWRYVGVEVSLAVYDIVGDPFKDRSLSAKVHRQFGYGLAAAAGIENAWRAGQTDGGRSAYGVLTKAFGLRETGPVQSVTLTAGVGNGRFNTWDNVEDGNNYANVFGSVAVRVTRWGGLFATWTGQNLNMGVSLAPLREIPLVITPVALDLDSSTDDDPRFAIGVGGAYTIR